jgi:tetratricopeptide (TPR) repeat protein
MRGRIGLLGLAMILCAATDASAGLYNTAEPEEGKLGRNNFELVFRDTLLHLRSIGIPNIQVDNALRKRYRLQAELAARANTANLTTEQKLNLSAVLLRCKKADEAVNLLAPLGRKEPDNFLVQSNLATAYHQIGQEQRAIDTLRQALASWPKHFGEVPEPLRTALRLSGWHEGAFDFYRRVEGYQLALFELRAKEGVNKKGGAFTTVDALFDDGKKPPSPVKFVGESGKFEPGKLARAEQDKLPKDAIDIVQQLLVWQPEDVRLYWLLGELYNAQGGPKNIRAARMIFDELGGFGGLGVRAEELADHRRQLLNYDVPEEIQATPKEMAEKLDIIEKGKKARSPIDWQTLGVGFGVGLLVAVFGMWQIREVRRRRQGAAAIK